MGGQAFIPSGCQIIGLRSFMELWKKIRSLLEDRKRTIFWIAFLPIIFFAFSLWLNMVDQRLKLLPREKILAGLDSSLWRAQEEDLVKAWQGAREELEKVENLMEQLDRSVILDQGPTGLEKKEIAPWTLEGK